MSRIKLRYVHQFVDRNGKARFYFRRRGVRKTLPGLPGSSEFMAAYAAMLADPALPVAVAHHAGVGSVAAAVKLTASTWCSAHCRGLIRWRRFRPPNSSG